MTETIYVIQISKQDTYKNQKWYSTKEGRQFEAKLGFRKYNDVGTIVFIVDALHCVNPNHCIVISDNKIEKYQK